MPHLHRLVHEARHTAAGGGGDEVRHVSRVRRPVVAVPPPVRVRIQRVVHSEGCAHRPGKVLLPASGLSNTLIWERPTEAGLGVRNRIYGTPVVGVGRIHGALHCLHGPPRIAAGTHARLMPPGPLTDGGNRGQGQELAMR